MKLGFVVNFICRYGKLSKDKVFKVLVTTSRVAIEHFYEVSMTLHPQAPASNGPATVKFNVSMNFQGLFTALAPTSKGPCL